jgi:Lysophospholipase catalytic domain
MSQRFAHLTTNSYVADLYPQTPPSGGAAPKLGVCLSGGGSRALSCALGQLSALYNMSGPNFDKTVLDQVLYLSSVSGGSWASVLFTFLPQTIDGQQVTDADFLISPMTPNALVKGTPGTNSPGNVCYMGPFCLGAVPQQFNPQTIGAFLYILYQWGFFGNSITWRWFWIAGVGELVLKPFGLYEAFYNPNVNYNEPSNYFSLSAEQVAASITPNNPGLTSQQFYLCRPNRPSLIVNTNLLQNYLAVDSLQIPVQATPIASGIPGQNPDGTIVGGGGVESFAFTSTVMGAGTPAGTAAVQVIRRYSLCDIAGCSSAFFAEYLLQYVRLGIDDIVAELERYLVDSLGFSEWLADLIGDALELSADAFLSAETAQIIPQYNYWPPGEIDDGSAANATYGFADGGSFDNTGILGMLAQTDANRIIAFINTETPLSLDTNSGELIVSPDIPLLFGYQDVMVNGQYVSYGGMNSNQPMSYVQVFSDANGAFAALRQGLYNASCGGSILGTATAGFLQTLTTVQNPVANIEAGRRVTVLWVYNNRVDNWQNAITDAGIHTDLNQGRSIQPSGPLANFPNYFTGAQLYLDQEAVNMLAQLSAWNVQQLQAQILGLLQS